MEKVLFERVLNQNENLFQVLKEIFENCKSIKEKEIYFKELGDFFIKIATLVPFKDDLKYSQKLYDNYYKNI